MDGKEKQDLAEASEWQRPPVNLGSRLAVGREGTRQVHIMGILHSTALYLFHKYPDITRTCPLQMLDALLEQLLRAVQLCLLFPVTIAGALQLQAMPWNVRVLVQAPSLRAEYKQRVAAS